jgi:Amt family ammonium transporter
MTWVIAKALARTIGIRLNPHDEVSGIDLAEHSEVGYDLTPVQHSAYRGVRQTLIMTPEDLPATREEVRA